MSNFAAQLPLIGGLFDDSQDQAMDQYKKNQGLWGQINAPALNKYNPEVAKYSGDYNPAALKLQNVQDSSARGDIVNNLNRQQYLADHGLSAADEEGYARAGQEANSLAKGREGAIMQNMAARGMRGGGQELALRAQASQDAANQDRMAGVSQAADSARQRALYTQAYGQGLSNLRGQDVDVSSRQAQIANQQSLYNTGNQNEAQLRNLNAQQQYGQYAAGERNQGQLTNNQINQQKFGNTMALTGAQAGANTAMGQGYMGENAANQSARNANTGLLLGAASLAYGGAGAGAGMGATAGTNMASNYTANNYQMPQMGSQFNMQAAKNRSYFDQ